MKRVLENKALTKSNDMLLGGQCARGISVRFSARANYFFSKASTLALGLTNNDGVLSP